MSFVTLYTLTILCISMVIAGPSPPPSQPPSPPPSMPPSPPPANPPSQPPSSPPPSPSQPPSSPPPPSQPPSSPPPPPTMPPSMPPSHGPSMPPTMPPMQPSGPTAPSTPSGPSSPTPPPASPTSQVKAKVIVRNLVPDASKLTMKCTYKGETSAQTVVTSLAFDKAEVFEPPEFTDDNPPCTLELGTTITRDIVIDWHSAGAEPHFGVVAYLEGGSYKDNCGDYKTGSDCTENFCNWDGGKCTLECGPRNEMDCEQFTKQCKWDKTDKSCKKATALDFVTTQVYTIKMKDTSENAYGFIGQFIPNIVDKDTDLVSAVLKKEGTSPPPPPTPPSPSNPSAPSTPPASVVSSAYQPRFTQHEKVTAYHFLALPAKDRKKIVSPCCGSAWHAEVANLIAFHGLALGADGQMVPAGSFGPSKNANVGLFNEPFEVPAGKYELEFYKHSEGKSTIITIGDKTSLSIDLTKDTDYGLVATGMVGSSEYPPSFGSYTDKFKKSAWKQAWPYIIISMGVLVLLGIVGFFVYKQRQGSADPAKQPLLS